MYKKLIYSVSFVLVLGVALTSTVNAQDPSLVGWWKLDNEGTSTVLDYSGYGRDGTIIGSPQFVPGVYGQALEFHGDPDYVSIDGYKGLLGGHAFSITAWIKTTGNGEIVGWGNNTGTERVEFRVSEYRLRTEHGSGNRQGDTFVSDNEWHHVALTVEENATISYPEVILYLDGEDDTRSGTSSNAFNIVANYDVTIGRRYNTGQRWFIGLIDDVRIYDRVLSADEIKNLAMLPIASKPSPADGAINSNTWASLSWSSGADAISHDVYFGDNLQDVTAGIEETFLGNQPKTNFVVGLSGFPYPDGLTIGTTYYWRADEIEADGTTIHKGDIWSFTVPPVIAANPEPADKARFVDPNVILGWTVGFGAKFHHVYFGDNFDDVNTSTGKSPIAGTTYTPGTLEDDKVYYWRVDGFDGITTHKGDVWSFRTKPFIFVYDPNLVAWWKLDEGSGMVIDYSGYGHHGTLGGDPQLVAGYDDDALEFDGSGDFVRMDGYKGIMGTQAFSITAWIKTASNGQIVGWGNTGTSRRVEFRVNGNRLRCESSGGNVQGDTNVTDDEWHHVAVTVKENATLSSGDVTFYLDGQVDTRTSSDTDVFDITSNFDVKIGQMYDLSSSRWFIGLIDDVRIYNKELTPEEIGKAMTGDPRLAWGPSPADGTTANVEVAKPLSWTPGDSMAKHDVYLGVDEQAVTDADTTGIYRGRQDANSYTPPESLDYDQTYYWRIDEVETDDTKVHKGRVWSFTVANFIVVDDFEDYDTGENQIWYAWKDGLGYGAPETPPYYAGNGTGSTIGDENTSSYTEETIVNGGGQAMPFFYDNNKQGYLQYSEAQMTLSSRRDWTTQGVKVLSLWFRGHPGPVGSFVEGPAGTYTITARGADITGPSDEFHFAYKQLSGPGTIIAKVESVRNTHNWAKAGVMIRDTLEASAAHAMMVVTPAQGVSFQRRALTFDTSFATTEAGLTAPQWVKIERDMGGNITASYSSDGSSWTQVGGELITMSTPMYIGLAVTAHVNTMTCEATFSNVQITGTASPQWTNQDIGVLSNTPEQMYVALNDSAAVYYDESNATQIDTWTEWNIELKEFAEQGVNLTNVNTISIGFGDKNNPQPGGSGKMYFDDIRLYRPRCVASLRKPDADFNNDCVVDRLDLEMMAAGWLKSDAIVATTTPEPADLVAHYQLDGNANDSSGNNYHGTEKGGPSYVAGKFDQAIHLDGFDDYVAIQDKNYADTGHAEVSVSAWIRTSNEDSQIITSFDRNEYWRLEINGDGAGPGQVGWDVMTSSGQVDYGSSRRVDDGQWHNVAGVFDNGTLTIYIDGSPETSAFGGPTFGTGTTRYGFLGIGSEATELNGRPNATGYFDGELDNVQIYSRALSQAEIAYLADATPGDGESYIPVASAANIYDEETQGFKAINFKDFAVLADQWLDEELWPAP